MLIPTLLWPVMTILLMATSSLQAQTYDFRTLPLPETLGTPIIEHINNAEQVVGAIIRSFDPLVGMAFQADLDGYTTFSFPGADVTVFNGISDSGELAGHFVNADGSHGFLMDTKGAITVVDFPGHEGGSWILDLNDRGTAVGPHCDPPVPLCEGVPYQGFLRTPQGEFRTLNVPGALQTFVAGINEHEQVVGRYEDGDGSVHGLLWTGDEAFSAIDFPGAFYTEAWDINNRREIVGSYCVTADDCDAGVFHGYLRTKEGSFVTIDFPGAVGSFLTGITDGGNVAGSYIESGTGNEFGFIGLRTAESH